MLSATAPEAQSNQNIMYETSLKIDIKEELTADFRDEEETSCSDYMYRYKTLEPSKYVNYYDSKDYVIELKNEIPEDECPQLNCSMNSKVVSENTETLTYINKQNIKIENKEEEFSLNLKEENEHEWYQFTINTNRLEEQGLLDNTPSITSIHYDILVALQEVHCYLCDRIFKNSFNLFKHNIEHMKIDINIREFKKINELQQYQYCGKAHISDVYSEEQIEVGLCGRQPKSVSNCEGLPLHKLKGCSNRVNQNSDKFEYCNVNYKQKDILYKHMKLYRTGNEDGEKNYKCDLCKRVYKSKLTLSSHLKRSHYDYGVMFACWCGEQFRSPILLREHKSFRHDTDNTNKSYKCKSCEAVYNLKSSLSMHIKRVHYDYGRTFECWCGKQFRTPMYLRQHKSRQHDRKLNAKNKEKFQCDFCHKIYKTKSYLVTHIKNIHCDYGKLFEYCCGIQFRSPIQLSLHKSRQHDRSINDTNNGKLQCDKCHRSFKNKRNLNRHKRYKHYNNYDKDCEDQCGNKKSLAKYICEGTQYNGNINNTNNYKFQCDLCQKFFKFKRYLPRHMQNIHCDYGKVFECWCGKQFRSPQNLYNHTRKQHCGNIKDTNNDIS